MQNGSVDVLLTRYYIPLPATNQFLHYKYLFFSHLHHDHRKLRIEHRFLIVAINK